MLLCYKKIIIIIILIFHSNVSALFTVVNLRISLCILSEFFNVKFRFCFAAVLLLLNFSTEDALLGEMYLLLELICVAE